MDTHTSTHTHYPTHTHSHREESTLLSMSRHRSKRGTTLARTARCTPLAPAILVQAVSRVPLRGLSARRGLRYKFHSQVTYPHSAPLHPSPTTLTLSPSLWWRTVIGAGATLQCILFLSCDRPLFIAKWWGVARKRALPCPVPVFCSLQEKMYLRWLCPSKQSPIFHSLSALHPSHPPTVMGCSRRHFLLCQGLTVFSALL